MKSAEAAVSQRRASAEKLRLDVQNTQVHSPVSGQIGEQRVQVGGLATAGQTVLAVVSTFDPVLGAQPIPDNMPAVDRHEALDVGDDGIRDASTLSTRFPSRSTTSKRQPAHSARSPV